LERSEGITRLRGRWQICPGLSEDLATLAIFHPAYLLRQPALKAQAWRDLLAIRARLAEAANAD
jgi:DNA polymerase